MDTNYVIAEDYCLPSKGEIYTPVVDPKIRLKSMTTLHEKKLLSLGNSDAQLKVLSEIIDDCMVEKKPISSYDMFYGDFEYLLHKLRVVTFGPDYPVTSRCPVCSLFNNMIMNLDDIEVYEMDWKAVQEQLSVKLPVSNKIVKIKLLTPRMKDDVTVRAKQLQRKNSNAEDPTLLYEMQSLIDTVDNEELSPPKLIKFVEELPMRDGKVLRDRSKKIKIGLDTLIQTKCLFCSSDYKFSFPLSGEFFDPTID